MSDLTIEKEVIGADRVPQGHGTPDRENQTESKEMQLLKKLDLLKEKHTKSIESEKNAANRTKLLADQITKVKKEIHAEEVARMDKLCEEHNFTYDEIIGFFNGFPTTATIEDIKALTR